MPSTDSPPAASPPRRRPVPLFRTLVRLRCPHCGVGRVIERHFHVRDRCAECNLRFRRGDETYFSGSLFINYFLSAGGTALAFLLSVWLSWPNVPWTAIAIVMPLLVVTLVVGLFPVSRVIFLTIDVNMRAVAPDEFI